MKQTEKMKMGKEMCIDLQSCLKIIACCYIKTSHWGCAGSSLILSDGVTFAVGLAFTQVDRIHIMWACTISSNLFERSKYRQNQSKREADQKTACSLPNPSSSQDMGTLCRHLNHFSHHLLPEGCTLPAWDRKWKWSWSLAAGYQHPKKQLQSFHQMAIPDLSTLLANI